MRLIAYLRGSTVRQVAAVAVVTAVSLTIIGAVTVTTTSVGCGMARSLGMSHVGQRCLADKPVAKLFLASPSPVASAISVRPPSPQPPAPNGASSYPPVNEPVSNYPPYSQPASSYPPEASFGSGYPFYAPTSHIGQYPAGLSCSLAVYSGPPGSGGFITFPGGNFIADPSSAVSQPTPSAAPSPVPTTGYPGLAYDRKYSRWVPVPYRWLSPDGEHYAFTPGGQLWSVTVGTGVAALLDNRQWTIVDVRGEGVYAEPANNAGLWLFPFSGTPRQITATGFWQAVSGGVAFGTPTSAVPYGATTTIVRLDIGTRQVGNWFSPSGEQARVIGFDGSSNPIVSTSGQFQSLWVVPSANSPQLITSTRTGGPFIYWNLVTDSHGVWFSGSDSSGPVIILLANGTLYGASDLGAQLAGGCF